MTRRARSDGDLLVGVLALCGGLVHQRQLLAAVEVWRADQNRSIGEILVEQGALDRAALGLIESELEDGELSLSATVAYRRNETLADDRDGRAAAGGSNEALAGSIGRGERFRIIRSHAQGGLGQVFLAPDAELNRQVALKELLADHAHDAVSQSRFVREAQVTGRLEHPGIVPVYGLGRHADGRPYYAMRFIEGETMRQAIDASTVIEVRRRAPAHGSFRFGACCAASSTRATRWPMHTAGAWCIVI